MALLAIRHGVAHLIDNADRIRPGDTVLSTRHITHIRTDEREPPNQLWIGTPGHAELRVHHDDIMALARELASLMDEGQGR